VKGRCRDPRDIKTKMVRGLREQLFGNESRCGEKMRRLVLFGEFPVDLLLSMAGSHETQV
jgi:hypothetical protein